MREQMDKLLAKREALAESLTRERNLLAAAKPRVADLVEAQGIFQQVAQTIQENAHRQIAKIVSRCLQTVFADDAYEFQIKFVKMRGKTEARLLFIRDGEEYDPLSSTGGGVVDIASFALRLACLLFSQPQKRRLLVLDEPFKMLSRDYCEAVHEMLLTLAKEMDIQFVMVTHSKELHVGKVVDCWWWRHEDCRAFPSPTTAREG